MKIWWQQPMPQDMPAVPQVEKMWDGVLQVLRGVSRKDTEITQHFIEKGTYSINTYYLQMYNNKSIVESVIQAEKQGYDAAVIGCWGDPGLLAARSIMKIPVIGIAQASYLISALVGRKAAAITVQPELIPIMEDTLRIYGFGERMITNRPIRAFNMTDSETGELFTDPYRSVIPKFESVARECIADGADTIIAACGWLGPAMTRIDYKEVPGTVHPVPVVDPCAAALKLTEAFVELHKETGLLKSGSAYYKVGRTVAEIIKRNFGAEAE